MTKLTKTRYKESDSKFSSNTTKRSPSMVRIPVKMLPEGKASPALHHSGYFKITWAPWRNVNRVRGYC